MPTLKDIWLARGMNSTEVAAAAKCAVPTLYKLQARGKEESKVAIGTVRSVCTVLEISLAVYETLDACPQASRHKGK